MKILQINVGRAYAAHDMAYATAKQQDMDILFVCEPNKKRVKDTNWIKDTRTDVAALILTKNVEVIGHSAGDGHLVLELETCDIVCCYVSPNIEMHQYELEKRVKDTNWIKDTRTDVAALILTKNVEVIGHSAGDGHLVLELETCDIVCCYVSPNIEMHQYELEVDNIMNRIDHLTSRCTNMSWRSKEGEVDRERETNNIDVTLSTNLIAKQITDWKVLDQDSLTEHNYISFEIKGAKKERSIGKGKPITTVDWDRFRRSIRTMADETEAQEHDQCTRLIQAAYRKSTQKQCNTTNTPYWWNENIDKKRKQCNKLRRNQTRAARSQGVNRQAATDAKEAYKVCKKDLVKTIRDTKWQRTGLSPKNLVCWPPTTLVLIREGKYWVSFFHHL
ncbi:hypothetical protein QE152_g32069 [Popillia japonica]|uniref:Polyprotein n=1 Tax=Popillia japonica TaxID=7064 RepID=A0AAW1J0X3_POPJA